MNILILLAAIVAGVFVMMKTEERGTLVSSVAGGATAAVVALVLTGVFG